MALLSKELVTIRDDLPVDARSRRDAPVAARLRSAAHAVRRARVPHARAERSPMSRPTPDADGAGAPTAATARRARRTTRPSTRVAALGGGRRARARARRTSRSTSRRSSIRRRRTSSIRCARRSSASRSPSRRARRSTFRSRTGARAETQGDLGLGDELMRDAGRQEAAREEDGRADEHRGARARARRPSTSGTCRRSTARRWRRSRRCSRIRPSRRRRRTRSTTCSRCASPASRCAVSTSTRWSRATCSIPGAARTGSTCSRSSSSTTRSRASRSCAARERTRIPFDQVPVECARDYRVRGRRRRRGSLRERFEPQLEALQLARLFHDVEMPLVDVLAEMEWNGITIDVPLVRVAQGALRARATARRAGDLRRGRRGVQHQLQSASCARFCSRS